MDKVLNLVFVIDMEREVVKAIHSKQYVSSDLLQFLKGKMEEAIIEYNRKFREIEALKELSYHDTVGDFDEVDPAPIE